MDKINKTFSSEIKQIGSEEDRVLRFITSTESEDRDGDVIEVDGWKLDNYMKNPVILYGHNYEGLPVGKSVNIQKDSINKKLIQDVKFPTKDEYEFADTVYRLAKAGYLNATSVGFIGIQSEPRLNEKGEYLGKKYKKQELLETSIVPVPSNPTALMEARSKGIINDNELKMFEEAKAVITKPGWDETETSFRFRVRNPDLFKEGSFRTVPIKKDKPRVNSVMGRLKGETTLTVQSVIFPKEDDWNLSDAKAWLREHEDLTKGVGELMELKEVQLIVDTNTKNVFVYENGEKTAKVEITPEYYQQIFEEKAGASISAKTKEAIKGCVDDLQKGIEKLNNIIGANLEEEEKAKLETSIKVEMSDEVKQTIDEIIRINSVNNIELIAKEMYKLQQDKTHEIRTEYKNNEGEINLDSIEFPMSKTYATQDELVIEQSELKTIVQEIINQHQKLKGGIQ